MSLSLEVFIPAIGQPDLLDHCIFNLLVNSARFRKVTVLDNGSKKPLVFQHLASYFVNVIRNDENIGMCPSLKQAMENCHSDILVFMHSDFMVYEPEWDQKLIELFKSDPKLAAVGMVGAERAEKDGGRSEVWCSFRDAAVHGYVAAFGTLHPVTLLDCCFAAYRKEALEKSKLPDLGYPTHHFGYDKDVCLGLVVNGYRIAVAGMDCEHFSGRTACQPECQKSFEKHGGEQAIYNAAESRYLQKWGPMLPISVDHEFNYRTVAGPIFNSDNP